MLSEKQINKFQEIYKKRFSKEISFKEAYEEGAKLVQLMRIIYKPISKHDLDQLKIRRKEL